MNSIVANCTGMTGTNRGMTPHNTGIGLFQRVRKWHQKR